MIWAPLDLPEPLSAGLGRGLLSLPAWVTVRMAEDWSITPGCCTFPSSPSAHSDPCQGAHLLQERCCWRHQSQQHICGQYRGACGHRGCDRHIGKWYSGQKDPQWSLLQGTCLLPQSRSCSQWSDQSASEGRASTEVTIHVQSEFHRLPDLAS
jgi:hypothetical protein